MDSLIDISDPGFGVPLNIRKSDPVHWWTTADEAACGKVAMNFMGPRYFSEFQVDKEAMESVKALIEERGVCIPCLTEILKAAKVLGLPSGFPLDLKVRIR